MGSRRGAIRGRASRGGPRRRVGPPAAARHLPEIDSALRDLPEEYRAAVLLVDVEELTYEEAAAALACPSGLFGRAFTAGGSSCSQHYTTTRDVPGRQRPRNENGRSASDRRASGRARRPRRARPRSSPRCRRTWRLATPAGASSKPFVGRSLEPVPQGISSFLRASNPTCASRSTRRTGHRSRREGVFSGSLPGFWLQRRSRPRSGWVGGS